MARAGATLARVEGRLREAGAPVRRGGDFDRWDLETLARHARHRANCCCGGRARRGKAAGALALVARPLRGAGPDRAARAPRPGRCDRRRMAGERGAGRRRGVPSWRAAADCGRALATMAEAVGRAARSRLSDPPRRPRRARRRCMKRLLAQARPYWRALPASSCFTSPRCRSRCSSRCRSRSPSTARSASIPCPGARCPRRRRAGSAAARSAWPSRSWSRSRSPPKRRSSPPGCLQSYTGEKLVLDFRAGSSGTCSACRSRITTRAAPRLHLPRAVRRAGHSMDRGVRADSVPDRRHDARGMIVVTARLDRELALVALAVTPCSRC